ncbi:MAG: hypothetical protein EKK37_08245 [Sphingobacteriales bacterium]|nr:MAG: hypothetical protein EKK37_08245 [Sphingobacteriales bacterium]
MKLLITMIYLLLLSTCVSRNEKYTGDDSRVVLYRDSSITVKLTDTLIIYESVCRGCQYENSTTFEIEDSTSTIKLVDIITRDNNPGNKDGGSISKKLLLVPQKTGAANFKLYKFNTGNPGDHRDSSFYVRYKVVVKN